MYRPCNGNLFYRSSLELVGKVDWNRRESLSAPTKEEGELPEIVGTTVYSNQAEKECFPSVFSWGGRADSWFWHHHQVPSFYSAPNEGIQPSGASQTPQRGASSRSAVNYTSQPKEPSRAIEGNPNLENMHSHILNICTIYCEWSLIWMTHMSSAYYMSRAWKSTTTSPSPPIWSLVPP